MVTPPTKARFRARRWLQLALGIAILLTAILATERERGQKNLAAWKSRMTAQGEILDPALLWPAATTESREFSNQLAHAREQLPAAYLGYCGMMSGWAEGPDGKVRRGSQATTPLPQSSSLTWADLDATMPQAEPALQTLRALMRNPPAILGDLSKYLENGTVPNYVSIRVAAQALCTAALRDLHHGNLPGARDNLVALAGSAKLNEADTTLVGYMIRVAVIGLGVSAHWDALQADGWTDAQLADLQRACQSVDLRAQMSKALAGERVSRLHALGQFRASSYGEWATERQTILAGFGVKFPEPYLLEPARLWRQWGFHPLWKLAWADQEALLYLQHMQSDIEAVREGDKQGNWSRLKQRLEMIHHQYQPPAAAWRYYQKLPLLDIQSEIIGRVPGPQNTCPFVDFTKAWAIAHQNLTQHNLLITAIALKRYHLRHGRYPATLAALTPAILAAVPIDLMDGQALRYRLNPDGSPTLYSVGEDFKDDGGTVKPAPKQNGGWFNPWSGPDWVWPRE